MTDEKSVFTDMNGNKIEANTVIRLPFWFSIIKIKDGGYKLARLNCMERMAREGLI